MEKDDRISRCCKHFLICLLQHTILVTIMGSFALWIISYKAPFTTWLSSLDAGWAFFRIADGAILYAYTADELPPSFNTHVAWIDACRKERMMGLNDLRKHRQRLSECDPFSKEYAWLTKAETHMLRFLEVNREQDVRAVNHYVKERSTLGAFMQCNTSPSFTFLLRVPFWLIIAVSGFAWLLMARRSLIARRRLMLGSVQCIKCGYTLLGLIERRCPECGSPIPEEQWRTISAEAAIGQGS